MIGQPTLVPDAGLRTESNGRVLLGGHPFRVLRLSASGASSVRSWFRGDHSPASVAEKELAHRLIESGLAHARPEAARAPCHVVIPCRDGRDDLERTLESLRNVRTASITVVDDGSTPPLPQSHEATFLRHETSHGPGAARNTGWRHVASSAPSTDLILFLDAGVVVPPSTSGKREVRETWIDQLCGHLTDEGVAAVAPRVASTPGSSLVDQYEVLFSPLDLGPNHSLVGTQHRVTYVPTACLLTKLEVLASTGGFDETMRYGEDVDLLWRIGRETQVRYDPSVVVHHHPRRNLRALALQRFHYATAAAALAERHPGASAPWRSSIVGIAGVALATFGHPVTAMVVGIGPVTVLADRLRPTATPLATSARLLLVGHQWTARSFAENMGRTWIAGAVMATAVPALRTPSILWVIAGWLRRLTTTRSIPMLAIGIVDDVSYGVGSAVGAARHCSFRSLLPKISRWG